HDKDKP
ncbi:metacaspase, partial [Skeletonema marinoi]